MDFYRIKERSTKGVLEIYPDFVVKRSKDLMIRGGKFYAIWDEEAGLWSTDEYDVQRLVDAELTRYGKERAASYDGRVVVRTLGDFSSNSWRQFRSYMNLLSDNSHQLDNRLTFANTEVKKSDYVSRRLPYALSSGSIDAYDELIGTLYDPPERDKLEWAIGSIVAGDSVEIQKFIVLYGPAGAGKSTFLNIVLSLFRGYYTLFEAKSLTGNSNAFSAEMFKSNPLVAVQHDGDLSRIEDNTKLNSIISHEEMTINEKFKPQYSMRINSFLFMGTNKPVKITDAKSGIIRRLIDVQPSGRRIPSRRYDVLMSQVQFELGAIAQHCLDRYREMGKNYYNTYRPVEMMLQTDVFYNFIEAYFDYFRDNDGVTLNQAYEMYKQFCEESMIENKRPRYAFREELKNYFQNFEDRALVGDVRVRSYYSGFKIDKFTVKKEEPKALPLVLGQHDTCVLDDVLADQPAQYANEFETPSKKWANVTTTLKDLDTTKLHYVKVPLNHVVIDFDIKDENGNKSAERNLEAASKWPITYAEFSKSGAGIHLHYIYGGPTDQLSAVYSDGIEVKVFKGDGSLRRVRSAWANVPISTLAEGSLPLKKEKNVTTVKQVQSERGLRELIQRNLRKEILPGTKPSIDFIKKILDDAYESDLQYDLSDMKPTIINFAAGSSHHGDYCLQQVTKMKFSSEKVEAENKEDDRRLVIFDTEVFPNLFVIVWKYEGPDAKPVVMVNPKPVQVEEFARMKLVGFNNKKYDNHMLYAAMLGYNNQQLFELSQRLIAGDRSAYFGEAYDLSYTDIYDFSSKKQSLKKFQIELGVHHQELGYPWDQPVPEELIPKVVEYCENDVISTEAVLHARSADLAARKILSELSGLSMNASTQQHTAKIIFGNDREHKKQFVYTDLSEMFPGYTFERGKSSYRGEDPGEGGYVYAEPGYYKDVALLDVASMHPISIVELNLFGDQHTKQFQALLNARLLIKNGDLESAGKLLKMDTTRFVHNDEDRKALAYALKIAINIVYGLTSAKFDNPFRDNRNVDNIVAKRGALFMIDLKHFVQERGFTVAHIKTDSIKIPNATKDIIEEVMEFGQLYGYTFEHEATYEKMVLVNNAVYVAYAYDGRTPAHWEAVGAEFQRPYVFKKLFSREPIEFADLCETKTVTTSMWLDYAADEMMFKDEADAKPQFVGRAGLFCPMKPGSGGGLLLREKDGQFYAVGGTKGYFWMEAERVQALGLEDQIDMSYFESELQESVLNLEKFAGGELGKFVSMPSDELDKYRPF